MQIANDPKGFSRSIDKPNKGSEKDLFSLINSTNSSKTDDYKYIFDKNSSQIDNNKSPIEPKNHLEGAEEQAVEITDTRQDLLEKARKAKEEGRLSEADYNSLLGLLNGIFSPQMLTENAEVDQTEFGLFFMRLQNAGVIDASIENSKVTNQVPNQTNQNEIIWELADTKITIQLSDAKVKVTSLEQEPISDSLALSPTGFSLKEKMLQATKQIQETNEDAVMVVPFQEFEEDSQVSRIMPSGNLKKLEAEQKDLVKIINPNVLPELDTQSLEDANTTKSKTETLNTKEITNMTEAKLNNENFGVNSEDKNIRNNSLSVLERINQVAMVQKISKRLHLRQLREMGIINMQLDPPELGRLLVKLTVKDKEVKVSIITESAGANDMLKNHKQVFMQTMKENGLDITDFDVSLQNGFSAQTGSKMNENRERMQEKSSDNLDGVLAADEKTKNKNTEQPIYASEIGEHKISLIA